MSEYVLAGDIDAQNQPLNQFLTRRNDQTDAIQLTISNYDGNISQLYPSLTTNSE